MHTKYNRFLAVLLSSLLFAACGGGGGTTPPPGPPSPPPPPPPSSENHAPTVSIVSPEPEAEYVEFSTVTMTAVADDVDDDALSITWTQTSGPEVVLVGADRTDMSFKAPDVAAEAVADLTFEVTVDDGVETATSTQAVTVRGAYGITFHGNQTAHRQEFYFAHPGFEKPRKLHDDSFTDEGTGTGQLRVLAEDRVAYTMQYTVFTAPLDGTGAQQITASGGYTNNLSVSPDGKWLAYDLAFESGPNVGPPRLFLMPTDGSNPPRVISGNNTATNGGVNWRHVAWSPNSTQLAFAGDLEVDDVEQVYVVHVTDEGRASLSDTLDLDASCGVEYECDISGIYWSADSERLVFTGNLRHAEIEELYLADANGANQRFVSHPLGAPNDGADRLHGSSTYGSPVAWSPDSSHIAFKTLTAGGLRLMLASAETGVAQERHRTGSTIDYAFKWSAVEDHLLAFSDVADGSLFLSRGVGDGGSVGPEDALDLSGLEWSPDGRFLAVIIDGGKLYVWPQDAEDFADSTLLVDSMVVNRIQWSPDGNRLAFRAIEADGDSLEDALFAVDRTGGNRVEISGARVTENPRVQFFISEFKWSPDSKEVAFSGEMEHEAVEELYVVPALGGERRRVSLDVSDDFNNTIDGFLWINSDSATDPSE